MEHTVSKSEFTPHALQYLRQVEETGEELVITDQGVPVLRIIPYSESPAAIMESLRNSVKKYENPLEPVGLGDWESLK